MGVNIYEALSTIKGILDFDVFPTFDSLETTDPVLSGKLSLISQKLDTVNLTLNNINDTIVPFVGPFAVFNLSTLTIPAQGMNFSFSPCVIGDISVDSSGNVVLPAGYSYDIDFNLRVNFTAGGYFVYNTLNNLFASNVFCENAVTSSTTAYLDHLPLKITTGKILTDTVLPIIAGARTNCVSFVSADLFVRGYYVG